MLNIKWIFRNLACEDVDFTERAEDGSQSLVFVDTVTSLRILQKAGVH
jgi:hypothetical protein